MGRIGDADRHGAPQAAPETEPETGQDDRQIVETLENVVQIMKVQRGKIVKQADAENGQGQQAYAQDGRFHGSGYSGSHEKHKGKQSRRMMPYSPVPRCPGKIV